MLISTRLGRIVSGAATLALLAGCSGGGAPGTMPAASQGAAGQSIARSFANPHFKLIDALHGNLGTPSNALRFVNPDPFDPAAPKIGLYAAQYGSGTTGLGGSTSLYAVPDTKNVKPVCSSTTVTAINGIGVDATGTLWVPGSTPANISNPTNNVYTYAKNTCTQGKTTFTETNGQASDIAFTTTGTTYVIDILNAKLTQGLISVYPKGKVKPTSTLALPGISTFNGSSGGLALGIATDSKNNVYASYDNTAGGTDITVFAGGKGKGKVLQSSSTVTYIGLAFDDKENLIAANASGAAIDIFKPPYTGKPTTIATQGSSVPVDLKVDATNTNLYVGDVSNGTIDVYKYPSGTYEYSISNGLVSSNNVEGVATDPSDNN